MAGALAARAERLYATDGAQGRRRFASCSCDSSRSARAAGHATSGAAAELVALDVDPDAMHAALDAFGRHRLLTFDRDPATREPTVEIAHEALLAAWERLRAWIDEARRTPRQERALAAPRPNGGSPTGSELPAPGEPPRPVRGLGARPRSRRRRRAEMLRASAERETRSGRGASAARGALGATLDPEAPRARGALAAAALVAFTLTAVAVSQRGEARNAAAAARNSETAQLAQRLGAQALVEEDLDLALLLARQSVAIDDSAQTRGYLLTALRHSPDAMGIMHGTGLLKAAVHQPRREDAGGDR